MEIDGLKYYVVYTRKLRDKLKDKGYEVKWVVPNYDKPRLDVYLFENTKEIREEVYRLTRTTGE